MHQKNSYRPSNGTEGQVFIESWCGTCTRDKPMSEGKPFDDCEDHEVCPILGNSMAFDQDHPKYPPEWIYDKDGKPYCTAWIETGAPIPYHCSRTKDMFE